MVRGGYGIYMDDLTADIFSRQYGGPFRVTETFTNNIVSNAPVLTFTKPFLQAGTPGAVAIEALALNLRNPQIQQWNLTVERELKFQTGVRLSYIGSKSSQLIYRRNINEPLPSTIAFNQNRRPYPLYQNINMNENGGNQIYHALSVEVQRRWSRGFSFQSAWTWSKNISDTDEQGNTEGGPVIEDTNNRARERSDVQYNPRHRFFAQTVWELPVGAGRRYLNQRGPANWILGGWQLTAVYTAQTGEYLTPTFSGTDPSNTNTIGGIPDRIGNGNLPSSERTINRWFDASAFVAPPVNSGRFGNSGKGHHCGSGPPGDECRAVQELQADGANGRALSGHVSEPVQPPELRQSEPEHLDAGGGRNDYVDGQPRGQRRPVGFAGDLSRFLTDIRHTARSAGKAWTAACIPTKVFRKISGHPAHASASRRQSSRFLAPVRMFVDLTTTVVSPRGQPGRTYTGAFSMASSIDFSRR